MPVYESKKKAKDGRKWYYRCYYTDMYGNRRQKESKLFKTKLEAKDAEAEFLSKVKVIDETDRNVSFKDVYNDWLLYKSKLVKCTTYYKLKKSLDKNIFNFFKQYKLHSIKNNTINAWEKKLINDGIKLIYLNKIIGYLKEILTYARDNYDFDNKIVAKIQKYKISVTEKKSKNSEYNFWTYNEFQEFLKVVDDNFYCLMYNFLYFTGLRLGEMIALTWNDINLEEKTCSITKTYTNKAGNNDIHIIDPKTENSIRTIDLDDNITEMLVTHYNEEKNIYHFNKNMNVFGNIKFIAPTTFAKHLNNYIKRAQEKNQNFKRITPHGFRHSHISLLIYLGCDSRDVAERVGDTVQMIEKTYIHMFPEKKSKTVNLLNNLDKNLKN